MQGCKDARMQDARMQGCKDARMQGCKDARMQGCRMQGFLQILLNDAVVNKNTVNKQFAESKICGKIFFRVKSYHTTIQICSFQKIILKLNFDRNFDFPQNLFFVHAKISQKMFIQLIFNDLKIK